MLIVSLWEGFAGFSYAKPIGLYIVYLLWPILCVLVYVVLQLILVVRTLDDRWPIGDIVRSCLMSRLGRCTYTAQFSRFSALRSLLLHRSSCLRLA